MRTVLLFILTILLALILGALGLFLIFRQEITEKRDVQLSLRVEEGTSLKRLVEELRLKGLLKHPEFVYYWARYEKISPKAGCYKLKGKLSLKEILKEFERGSPCLKRFTVPPGSDLFLLDKLLAKENICRKGELLSLSKDENFLKRLGVPSLNGFLFPDTYYINEKEGCRKAVEVAVRRFKEVVIPLFENYKPPQKVKDALGNPSLLQIVTVASIVEKETSIPAEKPLIAAVIYNRLKRGMELQCDPTVIYALKLKGKDVKTLTYKDLRIPSPYNTYYVKGLPPFPICNPSLTSIKAALYPADVDYLYFVATGKGGHVFSRSYNQHVKNVEKLRKWQRKRGS